MGGRSKYCLVQCVSIDVEYVDKRNFVQGAPAARTGVGGVPGVPLPVSINDVFSKV